MRGRIGEVGNELPVGTLPSDEQDYFRGEADIELEASHWRSLLCDL